MAKDNETETGSTPTGSLAGATEKLRDTAKMMIGSFAAVGVIFAAGLQLASIGRLDGSEPGRLILAILGLLLTIGGIVVAIRAATEISARSRVSLGLLENDPAYSGIKQIINEDTETLGSYHSVADLLQKSQDLRRELLDANQQYRAAYASYLNLDATHDTSAQREALGQAENHFKLAQRDVDFAASTRSQVLELAGFIHVRTLYEKATKVIALAAITTAVGLCLFAWGANPPEAPAPLLAAPVLPASPSAVTILPTDPQEDIWQTLGPECDLSNGIEAVVLSVRGDTYQVATLHSETCTASWLSVGPEQGQLYARETPEDSD